MGGPDEDGWTYVPAKKGRKRRPQIEAPTMSAILIDNDATVDSTRAGLERYKAFWRTIDARRLAYKAMRVLNLHHRPEITTAICMGLGTLCSNNLDLRGRSMIQLAIFLDIVRHLEETHSCKITLYAQEPRFTAVDKELLTSLSFTILELDKDDLKDKRLGPAAEHIGEHTFVADFFVDIIITQEMADLKIGLLTSALPMVIMNGTLSNRDVWKKNYRWCKLTRDDKDETALSGLYACALRDEDDTEG